MSKVNGHSMSIWLPEDDWSFIQEYQEEMKRKTGIELRRSVAIKTLIELAKRHIKQNEEEHGSYRSW